MDRKALIQRPLAFGMIFAAVVLFLLIGNYIAKQPPSFDGAMNLQVSYSLAHGEGYRRTYADRPPFPAEIQTNTPLLVPAAAVFKVFGVGKFQAQAMGLIYLAGLALVSLLLIRKYFGILAGATAAILVLVTPGIMSEGLNGYGEVPGLFWALLSLFVFPWQAERLSLTRIAMAGVFLGLAVCTKTVLLICFASFSLCYVLFIATSRETMPLRRFALLALLAMASLAPIALVEVWRLVSLGGADSYANWWQAQYNAINGQAGIASGFHDTTDRLDKLSVHADLLGDMYGLNKLQVAIWIGIPVLFGGFLLRNKANSRRHGALYCLIIASGLYFAWWLLMTPTEKAWHRRILDGSLMLNLVWVYLAAYAISLHDARWRWIALTPSLALIGMIPLFFRTDALPKLRAGSPDTNAFDRAVADLKSLPRDARLYGIGWYSAPALALFSERYLQDFNNTTPTERNSTAPSYLIMDAPALALNKQNFITSMYASKPLLDEGAGMQIYRIFFNRLDPKFLADVKSPIHSVASMRAGDDLLRGFYGKDSKGSRWMASDALVALRYDGSPFLSVAMYAPGFDRYMRHGGLTLHASVNNCALESMPLPHAGMNLVQFDVSGNCRPKLGANVVARISTNNLIDSSIAKDDRAASIVVNAIGFTSSCTDAKSCVEISSALASAVLQEAQVRTPELAIRPSMLDLCGSEHKSGRVRVSWIIPNTGTNSWKVWISAPGSPRKLWTAGQGTNGEQETGDWVVDGTTFSLTGSDDRELARSTIRARQCP